MSVISFPVPILQLVNKSSHSKISGIGVEWAKKLKTYEFDDELLLEKKSLWNSYAKKSWMNKMNLALNCNQPACGCSQRFISFH